MARTALATAHENGLSRFISSEWRIRFRDSLASDKRRDKVLARLSHFRHLDYRFADPVAPHDQRSGILKRKLRERGAPARCHIVSEDGDLDGREMLLDEALASVVDAGLMTGTFISCIPGNLAYFHDEEIDNRYILERLS